ncbi:MAG: hypothetical protein JWO72_3076 [Caulobacteraceae bacterium]|nr:hypothetical protein [Caulobacteraceae bacterium]
MLGVPSMNKLVQGAQSQFDKGHADALRALESGRMSMDSALKLSLSALWPAGLAAVIAALVFWRLVHWSLWTATAAGLAVGFVVLIAFTFWIRRALERARVHDPRPDAAPAVLDEVR